MIVGTAVGFSTITAFGLLVAVRVLSIQGAGSDVGGSAARAVVVGLIFSIVQPLSSATASTRIGRDRSTVCIVYTSIAGK
mgnify:CR=1 FL=1